MSAQVSSPVGPHARSTRVTGEISNAFHWLHARNYRIVRHLELMPEASEVLSKVLRGIDWFCRRHGLYTPAQLRRVSANVIYIEATDSIVIKLERT